MKAVKIEVRPFSEKWLTHVKFVELTHGYALFHTDIYIKHENRIPTSFVSNDRVLISSDLEYYVKAIKIDELSPLEYKEETIDPRKLQFKCILLEDGNWLTRVC